MAKKACKTPVVSLTLCLLWFGAAQATPLLLNNEYHVAASTMNVGPTTWQFTYQVANINQGVQGHPYGLDGFAIQVPDSATVISCTVPPPYVPGSGGYWAINPGPDAFPLVGGPAPDPGYHWMLWSGFNPPSVYPPGTTVTFSVTLAHVSLGRNDGGLVTYWGLDVPPVHYHVVPPYGNYTPYVTELVSPVAVPAPGAIVLSGIGMGLVGWLRRRRAI